MDIPFLLHLQQKKDSQLKPSVNKKRLQSFLSNEEHEKLREQLEKVHEYNQERGLKDRITEHHIAQDSALLSKIVGSEAYKSHELSHFILDDFQYAFLHEADDFFLKSLEEFKEKFLDCLSAHQSKKYAQTEYKAILKAIDEMKGFVKKCYQMQPMKENMMKEREEQLDKALEKVKSVLHAMKINYLPERTWAQAFSDFTSPLSDFASQYLIPQSSETTNPSSTQDIKTEVASTEKKEEEVHLESAKEKDTVSSIAYHPPKLKEYGGNSFMNAFINNMLVFLDEKDIEILEKEIEDGDLYRGMFLKTESGYSKDDISSLVNLQKDLINIWRACHKTPPEDITQYHRDFLFDVHILAKAEFSFSKKIKDLCKSSVGKTLAELKMGKNNSKAKVPEFDPRYVKNFFDDIEFHLFPQEIRSRSSVFQSLNLLLKKPEDSQEFDQMRHQKDLFLRQNLNRQLFIFPAKEKWEDNYLKVKDSVRKVKIGVVLNEKEIDQLNLGDTVTNGQYVFFEGGYDNNTVTPKTERMIVQIADGLDEKIDTRRDVVAIVAEHAKHGLHMPEVKHDDQEYEKIAVFKPHAIACQYDDKFFTVLLDENGKVVTEQANKSVTENLNADLKEHLSYFFNKTSMPYQIVYKRVE